MSRWDEWRVSPLLPTLVCINEFYQRMSSNSESEWNRRGMRGGNKEWILRLQTEKDFSGDWWCCHRRDCFLRFLVPFSFVGVVLLVMITSVAGGSNEMKWKEKSGRWILNRIPNVNLMYSSLRRQHHPGYWWILTTHLTFDWRQEEEITSIFMPASFSHFLLSTSFLPSLSILVIDAIHDGDGDGPL